LTTGTIGNGLVVPHGAVFKGARREVNVVGEVAHDDKQGDSDQEPRIVVGEGGIGVRPRPEEPVDSLSEGQYGGDKLDGADSLAETHL